MYIKIHLFLDSQTTTVMQYRFHRAFPSYFYCLNVNKHSKKCSLIHIYHTHTHIHSSIWFNFVSAEKMISCYILHFQALFYNILYVEYIIFIYYYVEDVLLFSHYAFLFKCTTGFLVLFSKSLLYSVDFCSVSNK